MHTLACIVTMTTPPIAATVGPLFALEQDVEHLERLYKQLRAIQVKGQYYLTFAELTQGAATL